MEKSANADWVHVRMKKRDLERPHAAPLVAYADEVARGYELEPGAVAYPDPGHGGTEAEVLLLFSHPGRTLERSLGGSGLLSLENDDPASQVCFDHCVRVGLAFDRVTLWNAVPIPLRPGVSQPSAADRRRGAGWLPGLLELLPNLKVVALLGTVPQAAWSATCADSPVAVENGPSAGQRGLSNRDALEDLFDRVAGRLVPAPQD